MALPKRMFTHISQQEINNEAKQKQTTSNNNATKQTIKIKKQKQHSKQAKRKNAKTNKMETNEKPKQT